MKILSVPIAKIKKGITEVIKRVSLILNIEQIPKDTIIERSTNKIEPNPKENLESTKTNRFLIGNILPRAKAE